MAKERAVYPPDPSVILPFCETHWMRWYADRYSLEDVARECRQRGGFKATKKVVVLVMKQLVADGKIPKFSKFRFHEDGTTIKPKEKLVRGPSHSSEVWDRMVIAMRTGLKPMNYFAAASYGDEVLERYLSDRGFRLKADQARQLLPRIGWENPTAGESGRRVKPCSSSHS